MNSVTQTIKSTGPKLVPFFKALTVYFVVFIPDDTSSILSTILKCLPVWSLILFLILEGVSGEERKSSRQILKGLIFCSLGDAFLIWPGCFEIGMIAFAIGHIFYILAFGFKPLNLRVGLVLAVGYVLGTSYLMPGLSGVLIVGVPIYTLVLTIMMWRALARYSKDSWTLGILSSSLGSVLFGVSDLIIGLNKFKYPIPHCQVLVMSTYYAAQFGIALSVIDVRSSQKLHRS